MAELLNQAISRFEEALEALPLSDRARRSIGQLVVEMVGGEGTATPAPAEVDIPRSQRDMAGALYKASLFRDEILGDGLCHDPIWYMLLDLFMATADDQQVTVTSLCNASGVPFTTALRQMAVMERHGLLTRRLAPSNRRQVFIEPTKKAIDVVGRVMERLRRSTGTGTPAPLRLAEAAAG